MLSESERALAIREGHRNAADAAYFNERPHLADDNGIRVFDAGFDRGWDAACAERDARIAELEQQLAEARKDAERLTNEQIDAGIKAWFSTDITINEGKDRGHPFRQRMRAAIRAAIKEQT